MKIIGKIWSSRVEYAALLERRAISAMAILALSLFFACSAGKAPAHAQTTGNDSPMILSEHPLAGSLWQAESGKQSEPQALFEAIGSADYLLLGEKHDNPRHHALQTLLIDQTGAQGRKVSLVFEMLEPHHQSDLDLAREMVSDSAGKQMTGSAAYLAELGEKLAWEARGWPNWSLYQPIFASAIKHGMPLYAGNPERDALMAAGREGKLSAQLLDDLWWERTYDEEQSASLTDELVAAHCGMMSAKAVAPMMVMQRLKDAHMARAMRKSRKEQGETALSILIAGNGHSRKDRGVPMFLEDDARVISVGLIEVVRGEEDASSYGAFDPELYDWIWFTPRVDEIDPCDKFREQLKAMQQGSSKKE
ncbi:ChaN family lipoprotein [uncultured Cohaesibacter sp.]|uniref:ChaN family lipoprotein n=2 Tax=uncultured Cohaesibacter sp. TaxID=1002546 RepID=UPI0029C8B3D4|nr:ChaN family lipoprotein [uncultured Cohaesibacter sp.]